MKISSEFQYIFLAGYCNSVGKHWQAQWFAKFPNAIWVEQANWEYPVRNQWVENFNKVVRTAEFPIVVIAHSLGCLTFIEWLFDQKQCPPSDIGKIKNAFLVAPPDCERVGFPAAIQGFDQMKLFALPVRTTVVASSNDPYCAPDRAKIFIKSWKVDAVWLENAGHINTVAGFGAWPQGLEYLTKVLAES